MVDINLSIHVLLHVPNFSSRCYELYPKKVLSVAIIKIFATGFKHAIIVGNEVRKLLFQALKKHYRIATRKVMLFLSLGVT